jgi:hypothetical protein
MKIVINHDQCQHGGDFADRCLAATIRNPMGHERYCSAAVEEDGSPNLTVVLIYDGQEHTLVLRNQRERELAAADGWLAFAERPASA